MGRHSAPDDEDDDASVLAVATAPAVPPAGHAGRHERDEPPARNAARGAQADLHLLRESSTLRARCAGGVVVPFVLFVVVLLAVGDLGAFLLWMWVPTIAAGLLVGTFLDLAHRRAGTSGAQS